MMTNKDMAKIIAVVAAWYARLATRDWALRRGFERWAAELLSVVAGAIASAAVLRIT